MSKSRSFSLLALMLASYCQAVYAEEANTSEANTTATENKNAWPQFLAAENLSEDDYIGEVPKVLTVSRLSQSLADAPSAVTVIDRETIRASGAVDIPELFRLVPGMYVGTNAGFVHNTNHVVSYHGMASAYAGAMQILINGRSVYSPLFGGVNWSELPIAITDIERIEITREPNAASYGANAFFGVINIITQSPEEQAGASVSATYGNGRREVFAKYASKMDNLSYRVTAGYRDDDGLDNRNDFKRTNLLNVQAEYRLNDKSNLEFEFGLANGEREEGNLQKDPFVFLPRSRDIQNNYQLIRWRHNLDDDSDFSLQAFHSYDHTDDDVISANLRPTVFTFFRLQGFTRAQSLAAAASLLSDKVNINKELTTERYDIETQHTLSLSPTLRGVWGINLRQDTFWSPHYLGSDKTANFNLQRLFGHAEWRPVDKLVLNAGAMLEHNSFTGTDVSPRASINFKINPNNTIRFGVSSALRTPNYLESIFNQGVVVPTLSPISPLLGKYIVGNEHLKPEKIISREIAYLGDFGQLSLDTRIFNDNISDYIKPDIDRKFAAPGFIVIKQPTVFSNGGDIEINGMEVQGKWRMKTDTNILLNYALVKINADKNQTAENITESVPRSTISALLTHRFNPQWDASFAYYQTSAVTALGDGDPVKLARRSDVRLARKFNAKHARGEISVVVENLFNEHYQEFATYNTLKRRARINLRLDI